MDTALKAMFPLRQTRDVDVAALKDASLGHRNVRKAARTFGYSVFSRCVEPGYEAAPKLRDLGEGVRLATLIDYANGGSFLDVECVRFEVPVRVRSSSGCFCKQIRQRCE